MLIDISLARRNQDQPYPFEQALSIPEMSVLGDPVTFSDARIYGQFIGMGETVAVRAAVEARVTSRCALCLEPVETPISVEVDEVFAETPDSDHPDWYAFEGCMLDPFPMAREALILELPIRFLCGEGCRGLCPVCGGNLNTSSCSCQEGDRLR